MTSFIDTNVIISLLNEEDAHHEWCKNEVANARLNGPVVITDVVYSECSVGMSSKADTDVAIIELALDQLRPTTDALFSAGRAFKKYKEDNKGPKTGVLPDFIIGAHANSEECALITCNAKDFTGYFENLEIKAP